MKQFLRKALSVLGLVAMLLTMLPAVFPAMAEATATTYSFDVPEGYTLQAISTENELAAIKTGKAAQKIYYYLTNDITVTAASFGIGSNETTDAFWDIFDGNGYTITFAGTDGSGVKLCKNNANWNGGLFFSTNGDAVIKNLTTKGTVTSTAKSSGVLVGRMMNGRVENCINYTNLTSSSSGGVVGSITGRLHIGVVVNCVNYGTITGKQDYVGGLVGTISYTTALTEDELTANVYKCVIANSANHGAITSSTNHASGILGGANKSGSLATLIQNCYNTGIITSASNKYQGAIASTALPNFTSVNNYTLNGSSKQVNTTTTVMEAANMTAADFTATLNTNIANGISYTNTLDGEAISLPVTQWVQGEESGYPVIPMVTPFDPNAKPEEPEEPEEPGTLDVPAGYVLQPIATEAELAAIDTGSAPQKIYYYLTNDITITADTFSIGNTFFDILDGNGYTVTFAGSDPTVGVTSGGLFTFIGGDAVIKNITFKGILNAAAENAGTVGRYMQKGTLDRIINYATVNSTQNGVGGLVGRADEGMITNCQNFGAITSTSTNGNTFVGGLVGCAGYNTKPTTDEAAAEVIKLLIANNANHGTVTGIGKLGGIVGLGNQNKTYRIQNCYNTGLVSTTDSTYKSWTGPIATSAWSGVYYSVNNFGLAGSAPAGFNGNDGVAKKDADYMKSQDFADVLNAHIASGITYINKLDGEAITAHTLSWVLDDTTGYPVIPMVTPIEVEITDRTALKAAIERNIDYVLYLKDSIDTYLAAVEVAKEVFNDQTVSQTAVDNATDTLNAAFAAMETRDISNLSTIKVACIGDSITAGSGASLASKTAYPAVLKTLLGSRYEVKNFGNSGKTLVTAGSSNDYTATGEYASSLAYLPDVVTIMLGTNDSKTSFWPTYGANYEEELRAMVETYRNLESKPLVIIATSPVAYNANWSISQDTIKNEIAPIQRKVAAEMGCPLIEIHNNTYDMSYNFGDGIHPNDAGYAYLAKLFAEGIVDASTRVYSYNVGGVEMAIDNTVNTITGTYPANVANKEAAITLMAGSTLENGTVTSPNLYHTRTYTVDVTEGAAIMPVEFKDQFGYILNKTDVKSANELAGLLNTVEAPNLGGYTFCGWDEDAESVEALFDTYVYTPDAVEEILPVYKVTEDSTTYTVTAESGNIECTNLTFTGDTITGLWFDNRVELRVPADVTGEVAYWTLNGQKLAYGKRALTFYVAGDTTVSVTMAEDGQAYNKEPSVSLHQYSYSVLDGKFTLSAVAATYVPEGNVASFGMYYTATSENMEKLVAGDASAAYVQVASSKKGNNRQYMTHLLGVNANRTRYAMAYMVMENGDVYYSPTMYEYTTNADNTVTVNSLASPATVIPTAVNNGDGAPDTIA